MEINSLVTKKMETFAGGRGWSTVCTTKK